MQKLCLSQKQNVIFSKQACHYICAWCTGGLLPDVYILRGLLIYVTLSDIDSIVLCIYYLDLCIKCDTDFIKVDDSNLQEVDIIMAKNYFKTNCDNISVDLLQRKFFEYSKENV